jgi:hypothetical protein
MSSPERFKGAPEMVAACRAAADAFPRQELTELPPDDDMDVE